MKLGKEKTNYDAAEYLKELKVFIQKYVTDYQTALKKLTAAQSKYDEAVKESTQKEALLNLSVSSASSSDASSSSSTVEIMYRLYNPNSGEHFYTKDAKEKNDLIDCGWNFEGNGWKAPSTSNTPVYRLYNPVAGEHHYTMDAAERDMLVSKGWNYEKIGWYSDDSKSVPIYRQYNPNQYACNHNYTTSVDEKNYLISISWHNEGIGWYGLSGPVYIEGIDVSEHKGEIDLSQYRNGFVIIRAGWGDAVTDIKFLDNVKQCEELGIPYGIYLYSYALNTKEAVSEADFMIALAKQCHPTVGVWFDAEDDSFKDQWAPNYASELVSGISQTFCNTVRNAGYHVGIYASKYWFDNYITGTDQYDKWVAWWDDNDGTFTDHSDYGASLHQYS
jgi:hypothetical protein